MDATQQLDGENVHTESNSLTYAQQHSHQFVYFNKMILQLYLISINSNNYFYITIYDFNRHIYFAILFMY